MVRQRQQADFVTARTAQVVARPPSSSSSATTEDTIGGVLLPRRLSVSVSAKSVDQRRVCTTRSASSTSRVQSDVSSAASSSSPGSSETDRSTHSPWAAVSVFLTDPNLQAFFECSLGDESWQPSTIPLEGDEVEDVDCHVHRANDRGPAAEPFKYSERQAHPAAANHSRPPTPCLGASRRCPCHLEYACLDYLADLGWTPRSCSYVPTRTFRRRPREASILRAA